MSIWGFIQFAVRHGANDFYITTISKVEELLFTEIGDYFTSKNRFMDIF